MNKNPLAINKNMQNEHFKHRKQTLVMRMKNIKFKEAEIQFKRNTLNF